MDQIKHPIQSRLSGIVSRKAAQGFTGGVHGIRRGRKPAENAARRKKNRFWMDIIYESVSCLLRTLFPDRDRTATTIFRVMK